MIIDANGNKIYFERDANVDEFITGKEKTYTSQTGLEFRFDINTRSALTDDPKTNASDPTTRSLNGGCA